MGRELKKCRSTMIRLKERREEAKFKRLFRETKKIKAEEKRLRKEFERVKRK